MFTNLRELIQSMPTEETCREYLAQQRWNGKPVCPYCGCDKVYNIEKGKRYKCGNSECYKKFSVTVGTIFEASNVPLTKWFLAIYIFSGHKKGISSYQLGKDIGVSQKAAWFMLHRIRELMRVKQPVKLDNIVEIDETWVGGKIKNMSKTRRAKYRTDNNGTVQNKTMVMGFLERGGDLKLIALGKDNGTNVLQPVIREHVDKDAVIITDGLHSYDGLANEYAAHQVVNHSNDEYVRDGVIHTNSIEGAFSMLKRSIIGIYHQVTPKHLARYCDETMFRYNLRKMTDANRFTLALQMAEGRLKYKTLVERKEQPQPVTVETNGIAPRAKRPVIQLKNGEVVGQYESLRSAAKATGLKVASIHMVLNGKRNTTGGFEWKYAQINS